MTSVVSFQVPGGLDTMPWRITASDGGVYWSPEMLDPSEAAAEVWVVERQVDDRTGKCSYEYRRAVLKTEQVVTITDMDDEVRIERVELDEGETKGDQDGIDPHRS